MPNRKPAAKTTTRPRRAAKAPPARPELLGASSARVEEILDAALNVLQSHGYRDTTMLQIATAARASKNTLYQHFPNKVALFEALVARVGAGLAADLAAALDGSRPVDAALQSYGEGLLRAMTSPPALAIQRTAIGEAVTSPELGLALRALASPAADPALLKYLRDRMRDGRLRKADASEAAELLVGLLLGDRTNAWLNGSAAVPAERELRKRSRGAAARFVEVLRG